MTWLHEAACAMLLMTGIAASLCILGAEPEPQPTTPVIFAVATNGQQWPNWRNQ